MMLKFTHQLALLILVPMVIQLCFLGVIDHVLGEVERDRQQEARAVDSLIHVNLILNDIFMATGSMMMFKATSTESFAFEFHELFENVQTHTKALKEIANSSPERAKELKAFVGIIDDITEALTMAEGMPEESVDLASIRIVGKLQSFIRRVNSTGLRLVEKETQLRKRRQEKQSEVRDQLKHTVEGAALVTVAIAAFIAVGFSLTFARRFNTIMSNTMSVAAGKPLAEPIKGSDELAKLDGVIHTLSRDLTITREKERAMIDNTAEIICSLDENLRMSELNPAITKRLGYELEELLGSNLISIIHPEDKDETYLNLQKCQGMDSEIMFEARVRSHDGRFYFYEWTAKYAPHNDLIFCVLHDITERKEAEKLKQEVMAMVSHDLRAPLTSLNMVLDMMLDGVVGTLNEKGNKMVILAQQSVSSLISMINDLLDVEKYESGGLTLNYEDVTIQKLVDNAIGMIKPQADKKNIKLIPSFEDRNIEVDADRVVRVIVNLVGNAIKFSPKDSNITVAVKTQEVKRGIHELEFQIIDEGPGIPEDKLEIVFEKFKQVGTGSEGEKKGTGLGLAICKAIVEAHGGRVGVRSVLGKGATFWFQIPDKRIDKA